MSFRKAQKALSAKPETNRKLIFRQMCSSKLPPRALIPYNSDAVTHLAEFFSRTASHKRIDSEAVAEILTKIRYVMTKRQLHKFDGNGSSPEFWRESMLRRIVDVCLLSSYPMSPLYAFSRTFSSLHDAFSMLSSGQNLFGTKSKASEYRMLRKRMESFL